MLGKILMVIMLICVLVLGYVIYYNLPANPVSLIEQRGTDDVYLIDYGDTPVFWENLRFADTEISYFIEPTCSELKESSMIEAMSIFSRETLVVSFYAASFQEADILIGCSDDYIELGENLFAAGEGGPVDVINTTKFKLIQHGKVMLFRKSDCEYPVVEIHELAHVFGFDHSPNPMSIMYNTSDCGQRITPDMVRIIREIYSVDSLPDLVVGKIEAVKKGRYLDFNITVSNQGLLVAENVVLQLSAGGEIFETIEMEDLGVGYGRDLRAENILLPLRSTEKIRFIVDPENIIDEISETNNMITLTAD